METIDDAKKTNVFSGEELAEGLRPLEEKALKLLNYVRDLIDNLKSSENIVEAINYDMTKQDIKIVKIAKIEEDGKIGISKEETINDGIIDTKVRGEALLKAGQPLTVAKEITPDNWQETLRIYPQEIRKSKEGGYLLITKRSIYKLDISNTNE